MERKFLKKGELTSQKDIFEAIDFFVPLVNKEFNYQEKNDFSCAYLKKLAPNLQAFVSEYGYVLYAVLPDYWGNIELNVLSFYIYPKERRRFACLKNLFDFVFKKASSVQAKQIVFGVHLGNTNRFNRFFIHQGFYPLSFIKTLP